MALQYNQRIFRKVGDNFVKIETNSSDNIWVCRTNNINNLPPNLADGAIVIVDESLDGYYPKEPQARKQWFGVSDSINNIPPNLADGGMFIIIPKESQPTA